MLYKKKDRVKVVDAGKYIKLLKQTATIVEVDKTYDYPYTLKFDSEEAETEQQECGGLLWKDSLLQRFE